MEKVLKIQSQFYVYTYFFGDAVWLEYLGHKLILEQT
jgi:hypothetical protein